MGKTIKGLYRPFIVLDMGDKGVNTGDKGQGAAEDSP